MNATISLKQLRTDPREYIRLLKSGYSVAITEHRKELVRTLVEGEVRTPQRGNGMAILATINALPDIETPYPDIDTVELIKKTRLEGYEKKRRIIEGQYAGSLCQYIARDFREEAIL